MKSIVKYAKNIDLLTLFFINLTIHKRLSCVIHTQYCTVPVECSGRLLYQRQFLTIPEQST